VHLRRARRRVKVSTVSPFIYLCIPAITFPSLLFLRSPFRSSLAIIFSPPRLFAAAFDPLPHLTIPAPSPSLPHQPYPSIPSHRSHPSPSPPHHPHLTVPTSPSPPHHPHIIVPTSPFPHHRPHITVLTSPFPHHPSHTTLPTSSFPITVTTLTLPLFSTHHHIITSLYSFFGRIPLPSLSLRPYLSFNAALFLLFLYILCISMSYVPLLYLFTPDIQYMLLFVAMCFAHFLSQSMFI